MDEIKSGWKTTEFWTALITANLMIFNEKLGLHIPVEAITSIAGVVIAYVLGRSIVKK